MLRGCADRRTVTAPVNRPIRFQIEEPLVIALYSSTVVLGVSPGEHLSAHPLRPVARFAPATASIPQCEQVESARSEHW